ncbi:hypothetical protein Fleli_3163 [Bernardetia litoralis DSM 6794]|uniref:Secretion system C-terminal sorting domain-containing protein n=1 Tax=Bernardetia litoralis (strain ATCC 23117 / DSM 6794 / NBRC 15988 / NCIMB 1366 / Fx l1 / Sio-4) TaxID=880071 RepID=I4ANG4_BERLS|nr:T9SS type A sorting domain-containing protein [Bernardetia litoralis]AFM05499.1 hypothetical protein Fleli_3163 [Bernardetia litoralis DSM 6794]
MQKTNKYILTILVGIVMTFGTVLVSNAQQQGGNSTNQSDTDMLTHIFSTLDGTKTNTGYLWDKTGYPEVLDSVILKHTQEGKYALTTKMWNSFAEALEFANVDETRAYKGLSAANPLQCADSNLVDFRMMAVKVDKIKSTAFDDNLLLVDTVKKNIYDVPNPSESPYEEKTIFLASLSHQTVFGKTVYFKVDESLLMGNLNEDEKKEFFSSLRISVGDCNGDISVIRNEIIAYTYPDYGTRRLKMKATVNGIQMESHFLLTLSSANSRYEDNNGTWQEPPTIFIIPPHVICGDGICGPDDPIYCPQDCREFPIPKDISPLDPKDPCDDVVEVDVVIPAQDCGAVNYGSGNGRTGCTIRRGNELIAAAKWDYEIAPRRNFTYRRHGNHNNLDNLVRAGAYIFLSNDNILNRPVILIDGYTNLDLCGYSAVGEVGGTFNDFANELLRRGYDVIYLNYEYMGNYIENNAAVLRELLVDVNEAKLQNAVDFGIPIEQNVVLGYSMGGAITRYELARMETENIAHDTRLYVSMDTPHKGANVPLGIQYFASDANSILQTLPFYMPTLLRPLTNTLFGLAFQFTNSNIDLSNVGNSDLTLWQPLNIKTDYLNQILNDHSAQQFIKYHTSFDDTRPNPEYEALQEEFRRMGQRLGNTGYPIQCENVAIINGDARGRPTIDDAVGGTLGLLSNNRSGYRYNFRFFDLEANLLRLNLGGLQNGKEFKAQLSFSGQDGTQGGNVSFVRMSKWWLGIFRDDATFEHSVTGRPDYDFAPGSFIRQDEFAFDENLDGIIDDFLGAEFSYAPSHFTFVPSVSAADINMPDGNHDNDFYLNYNLEGDATYAPVVSLTTFNVVDRNRCPFDRIYPVQEIARLGDGRNRADRDNEDHGTGRAIIAGVFLNNHFPVITNYITEFYDASSNNIQFNQTDTRIRCEQQHTNFELYLNGESLKECRGNTRYRWFEDGNFIRETDVSSFGLAVASNEIPRNGVASTIPHTIRVVIEKTPNSTAVPVTWIQVADISDTYYIGYETPITDCNGSAVGMGKIAVEDKGISSDIILYPNPTNTEFSLKTSLNIDKIVITNSLGQILMRTKKTKGISIDSLATGVYFVTVTLESGETKTQKLIIN